MTWDPLKNLSLDKSYKILIVLGFLLSITIFVPVQIDIMPSWKLFIIGIITIFLGILLWQNSEHIQRCHKFNNLCRTYSDFHYNLGNVIQHSNTIKILSWLIYFLLIGFILCYGNFTSWFYAIKAIISRLPHK